MHDDGDNCKDDHYYNHDDDGISRNKTTLCSWRLFGVPNRQRVFQLIVSLNHSNDQDFHYGSCLLGYANRESLSCHLKLLMMLLFGEHSELSSLMIIKRQERVEQTSTGYPELEFAVRLKLHDDHDENCLMKMMIPLTWHADERERERERSGWRRLLSQELHEGFS